MLDYPDGDQRDRLIKSVCPDGSIESFLSECDDSDVEAYIQSLDEADLLNKMSDDQADYVMSNRDPGDAALQEMVGNRSASEIEMWMDSDQKQDLVEKIWKLSGFELTDSMKAYAVASMDAKTIYEDMREDQCNALYELLHAGRDYTDDLERSIACIENCADSGNLLDMHKLIASVIKGVHGASSLAEAGKKMNAALLKDLVKDLTPGELTALIESSRGAKEAVASLHAKYMTGDCQADPIKIAKEYVSRLSAGSKLELIKEILG